MKKSEYNIYLGKAYRFITIEGLIDTIKNGTLRFSRGDTFNDPLDMNPLIVPYDWNKYKTGGPEFLEDSKKKVFQKVFSTLYVCCFSKEFDTENAYLMWSHYAKNHTQVCYEIDFSTTPYLGGPSEVNYPNNLVAKRDTLFKQGAKKALFSVTTKTKQWKYEREVRLVIDTKHPNISNVIEKISEDKKYIYIKFDPNCITKVTFGVHTELNDIVTIMIAFSNKNLKPEFFKMKIDPQSLKLIPAKIDSEFVILLNTLF